MPGESEERTDALAVAEDSGKMCDALEHGVRLTYAAGLTQQQGFRRYPSAANPRE